MKGSRSPRTKTHPYRNVTKKFATGFVESDYLENSNASLTRYDSQGSYEFSRDNGTDVELLKVQLAESIDEIHALKSRLHKEMMDKQALEYKNKELVEKLIQARQGLQETHNALYKVQQSTDELAEKDEERDYKVKVAMEQVKLKDEKILELQSKLLETEEGERIQNATASYRKIIQEKDEIIRVLEEQQFNSQNQLAKRKRENQRLSEEKADVEFTLEMKVKRIETLEKSYKELQEKLDGITASGGVLSKEALLAQLLLQALPANFGAAAAAVVSGNPLNAQNNSVQSNSAEGTITSAFAPPITAMSVPDPNNGQATYQPSAQQQQQQQYAPQEMSSIEARLSQLESQFRTSSAMSFQGSTVNTTDPTAGRGSSQAAAPYPSSTSNAYSNTPAPTYNADPNAGAYTTTNYYPTAAPGTEAPSTSAAASNDAPVMYTTPGYYDPNVAQAPVQYSAENTATPAPAVAAPAPTEAPVVENRAASPIRRQSSSSGSRKSGRPTLFAAAYKAAQNKSSTNLNGEGGGQRASVVTPNTANGGAGTSRRSSNAVSASVPVSVGPVDAPGATVATGQANGGWEY